MTYKEALNSINLIKSDSFNSNWAAWSDCDIIDSVVYQYKGTDEDGSQAWEIIPEDKVISWLQS